MSPGVTARSVVLRTFLGSAALIAVAATAAPQVPPRFPAEAGVVRIDAVVVDDSGRPVTGLTAADFVVEEDGEARDIASFESIVVRSDEAAPEEPLAPAASVPRALEPEDGRALLIFFDDIHVSPPSAEWVRHNLGPFLGRELRPGDAVTIVAPHANFWWTARTPWEHGQLPAVIERLKGQYAKDPFKDELSDWQVMYALEYEAGRGGHPTGWDTLSLIGSSQYDQTLWGIRRTLTGLQRAIDSLDGFRGRKSVVVYSEGFILSPRLGEYQWIIDRCRRANIALFVAGAEGLRTGRPTAESRTGGMSVGPAISPTLGVDVPSTGNAGRLTGWLIDAETAGSTHVALATGGEAFFVNEATRRWHGRSRSPRPTT